MAFRVPKIRRALPFQRDMARQMNAIAEVVNRGLVVQSPTVRPERLQDGRIRLTAGAAAPISLTGAAISPPAPGGELIGDFMEFYCQNGGSNLNAGSTNNNTAAYSTTNGNWNGTTVFTPTDGSTPADTVAVGDFVSIFLDGASVAAVVKRVTLVASGVNGAITVSNTAGTFAGANPTSGASGRSLRAGGAWKGPNGTDKFPFTVNAGNLRDADGRIVRVNLKNDQTYGASSTITNSITNAFIGGFISTPGDQGKALFSFGLSSTTPFNPAGGSANFYHDLIFENLGGSQSSLVSDGTSSDIWFRCVFRNCHGPGKSCNDGELLIECEAYDCNGDNLTSGFGFGTNGASTQLQLVRCIAHHNKGYGFLMSAAGQAGVSDVLQNCISALNTGIGMGWSGDRNIRLRNCDIYGNSGDAFKVLTNTASPTFSFLQFENSNFVKNGGWAINGSAGNNRLLHLMNCRFGAGSMENTSGDVNPSTIGYVIDDGTNGSYASGVHPWTDPEQLNFSIVLSDAIAQGRGQFTMIDPDYTGGTVGYPDIGAAQHLS